MLKSIKSAGLTVALLSLIGTNILGAQTSPELPEKLARATPGTTTLFADAVHSDSLAKSVPTDHDSLLDLPPLPHSPITLIGGTVTDVDSVEDRVTVRPFSSKQRVRLDFDVRTHIFRDGVATSGRDLKAGERVYLDTMLDGTTVFAKNIWIENRVISGIVRGQIVQYDDRANKLTIQNEVSSETADFQLNGATLIREGETTRSIADLKAGALVAITFAPGRGRSGIIKQVSLLAEPGSVFAFLGKVTFIDLSQKLLALTNQSDDKSYDIYFEAIPASVLSGLREGSQASIAAVFDGTRYVAEKVNSISGGGSDSTRQ